MICVFSSIFIDDSRWLSYCEVRGDVSHRFDSKWTHFQWKEAAGYEYVSTTEQHMRLFEAACRVSLKHLTDEILSGKNLFISSAAATVPEVMSAEEEEDLSSCFFAIYLPEPEEC